jgi:hypothetical protein
MIPGNLAGGENLQKLEAGYNTLAVKALAAFKAAGATFGALSKDEGEWVRSTTAKLNKSENVNLELLNQGLALLEKSRAKLVNDNAGNEQQKPNQAPAYQSINDISAALKSGQIKSKDEARQIARQLGLAR